MSQFICVSCGRHSGAVVSTVSLQPRGPWFDFRVAKVPLYVVLLPCICVGFLWVRGLPPTVQTACHHVIRLTDLLGEFRVNLPLT